jgi:hypothetical protein
VSHALAGRYGKQWEPGQLVNSVDHANTSRECLGADFAQSPRISGKRKKAELSIQKDRFQI